MNVSSHQYVPLIVDACVEGLEKEYKLYQKLRKFWQNRPENSTESHLPVFLQKFSDFLNHVEFLQNQNKHRHEEYDSRGEPVNRHDWIEELLWDYHEKDRIKVVRRMNRWYWRLWNWFICKNTLFQ